METNKPAHLLTLSEYQETVSPIIKEFVKFIRKNRQYYIKANFYGLVYLTFDEFKQSEHFQGKYARFYDEEYISNDWMKKNQVAPLNTPDTTKAIYADFNSKFIDIFGKDIVRVEDDEVKSNKRSIRRAIDNNTYVEMLLSGDISIERITEIFDSVGIKIPSNILKMKDKVSRGYNNDIRELTALRTAAFISNIKVVLRPVLDEQRAKEKLRIENMVNKYLMSDCATLTKYLLKYRNVDTYTLSQYVDGKEKHADYDAILDKHLNKYVDGFIDGFARKVNVKLSELNINNDYPELSVVFVDFSAGKFTGTVNVVYSNGFTFKISASIIYAGGYNIQSEHTRYIFNLNYDGKSVSNKDLEDLYKSF